MKKIFEMLILIAMVLLLSACSSTPCEDCGNTPTKAYKNDNSGENEYYCKECASDCNLCSDEAEKHYTGGGGIVFICNDCYEELKSYGWVS